MKFLSIILVLGLASTSFADSHEESLYVGVDKNGKACQVKLAADVYSSYVKRDNNGSISSSAPFPGALLEVTETYTITGRVGENTVAAGGPLKDLQAALRGEVDSLEAIRGSNFNAGLGKNTVVMTFSEGKPVSAKFKFSYLFTGHEKSECLQLIKQ